jgi:hypothetical protein
MHAVPISLKRHGVRVAALALIGASYLAAHLPETPVEERAALVKRFRFVGAELQPPGWSPTTALRRERAVHPSLAHLSAWISSMGAAAALADLDGNALADDICYVDTRTDEVVLAPVPQEGAAPRYAPFALTAAPLAYDAATMAPMGCLPGDLDEDGRMDLVVYYWGRSPLAFLRRDPEQAPAMQAGAYRTHELVPGGERWFSNCATRADVDGDGHADLIVGNYFADDARILDRSDRGPAQAMQDSMSRAFNGGRNRLLLCRPAPEAGLHCVDTPDSFEPEVARGWTLAVGAADLDGDQLPELYFANDFGPDRLLHNRSRRGQPSFARVEGRRRLMTPRSNVLGRDSFKGMGVEFADLNGDGLLDIFVTNIADTYALQESHFAFMSTGEADAWAHGRAPYVEQSEALGLARSSWGWDLRVADFDNDGALEVLHATGFVKGEVNRWPELQELAMGNDALVHVSASWPRFRPGDDLSGARGLFFFARDHAGRFVDLATGVGLDAEGPGRGLALADVDADGDLDIAVGNQWAPALFYRNEHPGHGRHLTLRLLLPVDGGATTRVSAGPASTEPALPALGASASVRPRDGAGPTRVAQVDGGNGHSGRRSPDLHFGLGPGDAREPLAVDLRWRDLAGHLHQETHALTPGWHTLLLAGAGPREVAR